MSSEVLVYGFIEFAPNAAETVALERAEILETRREFVEGLWPVPASISSTSRSSMLPFARIWSKLGAHHCDDLRSEFEVVLAELRRVELRSAHLTIEDDEEPDLRSFEYVHGPLRYGAIDVLTRSRLVVHREQPEKLEPNELLG